MSGVWRRFQQTLGKHDFLRDEIFVIEEWTPILPRLAVIDKNKKAAQV
jgi:hypothetical protein